MSYCLPLRVIFSHIPRNWMKGEAEACPCNTPDQIDVTIELSSDETCKVFAHSFSCLFVFCPLCVSTRNDGVLVWCFSARCMFEGYIIAACSKRHSPRQLLLYSSKTRAGDQKKVNEYPVMAIVCRTADKDNIFCSFGRGNRNLFSANSVLQWDCFSV